MSQGEAQGQRLNSVEMDFSPSFLGVLLSSPKSSIFVVFFFRLGIMKMILKQQITYEKTVGYGISDFFSGSVQL